MPVPMPSTALAEPAYAEKTAAPPRTAATPPRASNAKPRKVVKKESSRTASREARRDRSYTTSREARRDRSYYVDGRFGWGGSARSWGYSW
jgi:hypothetical protein